MGKAMMRHVLIPATAFVVTAGLATAAYAVEAPLDVSPEALTSDQIASQDSAVSVVEGPSKSATEVAADRELSALPEVSAEGDIGPMRCDNPVKTWYKVSGKKSYHVPSWWNGTSFKDGPGGSMRVSVEKAGKIAVEASGTGGFEASAIVATVKAEWQVKVVAEVGVTVGHTYTHSIPANKYGHLQYGSWGYKADWVKYKTSSDRCSKVKIGSGTAKLPTRETGWRYWSTNS
ncbi:hypothetical protein [Streptomyces sp. NPDC058620]|uniref:hypothetical protein n=1 Tax=Streptomyces sp. NPDC058620 TaxID=3346560 RepID=UPI00364C6F98